MPNTTYQIGATSKIITMRAWTLSTGAPYTAGVYNTSGLVVHYTRDGATQQTITQVTATAGTYTTSGFVHRGDGIYEIGAPTASLAAGADGVTFTASGVTDVVFEAVRVELVGIDPRSATAPDVNLSTIAGKTANAAGAVTFPGTIASPTNITAATGVVLSAAGVQAIWDALTSALVTAGSIGKWIVDKLDAVLSTRLATSGYTAPLDAAGTRTALGLASANLDTQLDALPTNAELAMALGTADDAVLAAIAALNNLSSAGAQSAAAAALTAYTAATAANVSAVPAAVLAAATSAPIAADVKKINAVTVTGTGVNGDEWGP